MAIFCIYLEGRPCQEQSVSRVTEGGHAVLNRPYLYTHLSFGYPSVCIDASVLGHIGTYVILRSDRNREPASCRRDCNGTRGIVI